MGNNKKQRKAAKRAKKKATADKLKTDNAKREKDKAITKEEAAKVATITKEGTAKVAVTAKEEAAKVV